MQLYHQAYKEAASPAEEAEALNALARCAYKGKDAAMEEKAHRTLVTLYGHIFDADGAHPVTLSHLRLGRYAAPEQAQASLMAWAEALLKVAILSTQAASRPCRRLVRWPKVGWQTWKTVPFCWSGGPDREDP